MFEQYNPSEQNSVQEDNSQLQSQAKAAQIGFTGLPARPSSIRLFFCSAAI